MSKKLYNIDVEWLKEQYHIKKRTMNEIGLELGCSRQNISLVFKRYNLGTRSTGKLRKHDELKILELINKGLADKVISKIIGCWQQYIYNTRINNNLPSYKDMRLSLLLNKDWLRQKYVEEKMSQKEIASIVKCTYSTVAHYIRIHNIPSKYNC